VKDTLPYPRLLNPVIHLQPPLHSWLRRTGIRVLGSLFLFATVSSVASSTTLHVPGDYPTIQAAIDAASAGDQVLVASGTYFENLHTRGKSLIVRSQAGATATIVDGRRLGSVLVITGGGTVEGFTFRNGQAQDGGGIHVQGPSETRIQHNVIEQNRAGFMIDSGNGGGVWSFTAAIIIEENTIRNNYAGASGGGIYASPSGIQILANIIQHNGCHVGGGGIDLGSSGQLSSTVANNLILNNTADSFGAGINSSGMIAIESNTVVGNYNDNNFAHASGIRAGGGGIIRRNIVVRNTGRDGSGVGIACSLGEMNCNDSWSNDLDYAVGSCDTTGLRNFSFDPEFCDEAAGDFRISSLSRCSPELSLGCDLIGARPVGCGVTKAANGTWGRIKLRYR
jgi:hypothetical protein